MMLLTDFIEQAHDEIIADWVAFAASILPWAQGMSEKDLRDHAEELLAAVVKDMETPRADPSSPRSRRAVPRKGSRRETLQPLESSTRPSG